MSQCFDCLLGKHYIPACLCASRREGRVRCRVSPTECRTGMSVACCTNVAQLSYQDFIKETLSIFCTRTEEEVGQAVKESGVKREDIFLVTKLADEGHGYEECLKAFDVSRKK